MDAKISCAGWVVVVFWDDEIRTYRFSELTQAKRFCFLHSQETHLMGW